MAIYMAVKPSSLLKYFFAPLYMMNFKINNYGSDHSS